MGTSVFNLSTETTGIKKEPVTATQLSNEYKRKWNVEVKTGIDAKFMVETRINYFSLNNLLYNNYIE